MTRIFQGGLAVLLAMGLMSVTQAQPSTDPGSPAPDSQQAPNGALSCLGCHNDAPSRAVLDTPHAVSSDPRSPMANGACEACHGASPEHRRLPRNPVAIQFGGGQ